MINELRLQNFKCFSDTRVPLSGLSLLAGANAAGKSSTIQALLLLRQSHLRGVLKQGELLLNGLLANVGTARDALNENANSFELSFTLATTDSKATRFAFHYESARRDAYVVNAGRSIPYDSGLNLFAPKFNYLNAERVGPRLLYAMAERRGDSFDVGIHGEYTADVLAQHRDEPIACEELAYRDEQAGETSRRLEAQTRYWMQTIVPNFDINLEALTNADQVVVKLRTGTVEYVRPTNIGFGIIYTLPIVVAALVAPKDSLLIVENPEAHLHPASQSQIGMFLAHTAAAGVQVIIETHSDHVLNGLRRAVRYGKLTPERVAISSFSKAGQVVIPRIYKDGGIDRWPDGFFDQIEKDLRELF